MAFLLWYFSWYQRTFHLTALFNLFQLNTIHRRVTGLRIGFSLLDIVSPGHRRHRETNAPFGRCMSRWSDHKWEFSQFLLDNVLTVTRRMFSLLHESVLDYCTEEGWTVPVNEERMYRTVVWFLIVWLHNSNAMNNVQKSMSCLAITTTACNGSIVDTAKTWSGFGKQPDLPRYQGMLVIETSSQHQEI